VVPNICQHRPMDARPKTRPCNMTGAGRGCSDVPTGVQRPSRQAWSRN
jgi:hypothetical protein